MHTSRIAAATGIALAAALGLAACAAPSTSEEEGGLATISVGATATPAGEILQHLIDSGQAEAAGLDIQIQEYTDYNTPNQALEAGDNDANLFQHGPFLDLFNEQNGTELESVGQVYLPPLALYSRTVDDLADLPDGATIALPNDASNEGRALLLLEANGLIEVTDAPSTVADITANPNGYEFSELGAETLPQALDSFDAAIVNFNFAFAAGLDSSLQLFAEDTDSIYYNILATNPANDAQDEVATLYELLTSDETKAWIEENYGGLVIPAP